VALLLTDAPRYALSKILLCVVDWVRDTWRRVRGLSRPAVFDYCPSVCAIIAGYNEEDTIEATLASIWGTYPWMEIIVVDDGSIDDMVGAARRFAHTHDRVRVLRREERGGKSSAMNWARIYTQAEIIVVVDADSHLGPAAIWEMAQPFQDPRVGAVAGAVLARNPFTSLATWLQAYEYLSTIFVGRMVAAKLGILGIVSGAMGAFRRTALEQVGGWDVGPPEDLDLTLALRKMGYRVAFAPYAECFTELPTTWTALARQRLRWERSGVVRNHCRKHLDLAHPWAPHFRFSNFFTVLESWFFNIFCMYGIWIWAIWFFYTLPDDWWQILLVLYFCYLTFEFIQILVGIYYSNAPRRDLVIYTVFFVVPLYQMFLLTVRGIATTEEILFRKSFQDNYVPERVRHATWHW
jgi:cellulose synthase/poly-beta-1,6-N-acetylglucosamine synthase-like glycosyltransferase